MAFAGERCRGVVEGFVDRVDVWQSGGRPYVRVVDYKTGKKSFDYTNVLHGRGLQMLLYLFALVRQGGHLLHGEPLPAGVLYFPARIERVSVRDRLAQAEIEKERRKQLRRSGVLLNSDPVLEAMEPCGGSPRFLPYTLDKEGRKTGDPCLVWPSLPSWSASCFRPWPRSATSWRTAASTRIPASGMRRTAPVRSAPIRRSAPGMSSRAG